MFDWARLFFTDREFFGATVARVTAFVSAQRPVLVRLALALLAYAIHRNWIPTYIDGGGESIGGALAALALGLPSSGPLKARIAELEAKLAEFAPKAGG
jgi:hypothetical protein